MAAWDKNPIVQPKAAGGKPWEKDPIAKPGGDNLTALREALRTAHDTGNTAEERRLSGLLKQIDTQPMNLGETTMKPVSADSMYQPGFKPLDQAGAAISSAINQIPVAGSWLEKQAAHGQAWLHNTMKPNDIPISQGDVLNTNMQREAANPEGATAGKVAGNVAPYVAASKFALPAKVLGLEGSLASRIGFTGGSQLAINTGDRMVREGEGLPEAAMNSILPTLLAMPLAAFGSPTRAGQVVTSELKRAGISAADVQAELDRLGPGAVIGDLSPQLQARLGALATSPGPAQDMAVAAMSERAAGANARIKGAVQDTFGPEPVPSQVAADIDAARKQANKAYQPVLRENALGPSMGVYDAAPLARAIDDVIPTVVGNTRSQVEAVRKMLIDPATGKLTTDPEVVLAVRGELDGMIEALKAPGGNRTTFSALSDLRRKIDADLGQQVPGIKMADAGRAEVGAQERGFELGRDALRNGESAIHPADLRTALDDLSGPQGTAIGPQVTNAPQRVSEGALSRIYQAIGVTANDRVALKQLLKGDGSWNREKMNMMFGPDKTAKLISLLDNEAVMAQTENLVLGNSKTSLLQSAKEALGPATGNGPVRSALNMKWGDAVAALMDKATLGAAGAERQKANKALVEALLSASPTIAASAASPGQLLVAAALGLAGPITRHLSSQ